MTSKKPITIGAYAWDLLGPRLAALSHHELRALMGRAGVPSDMDENGFEIDLFNRAGYLLVEFELLDDPKALAGIHFSYDIHEYVINQEAAVQLAAKEGVVLRHPGGDIAAIFTYEEAVAGLMASPEFDQIDIRPIF